MVLKQLSVGSLSLGHNIYFDITCFRGRAGGRDLNARTKFSCFSHKLITPTNLFALSPAYLSFKGIVPQKFLPIKNSLKHFKTFCEAVLFPSTTWYFAPDHSYSHAPVTILIPNGSRRPPSPIIRVAVASATQSSPPHNSFTSEIPLHMPPWWTVKQIFPNKKP